jgi:hypothetical protein
MEYILDIRCVEAQKQNTLTSFLYVGDVLYIYISIIKEMDKYRLDTLSVFY